MDIDLRDIGEGCLSLEFQEQDVPKVEQAIRALFGKTEVTPFVMASDVKFGGATFTFQNEWQDPCLISKTDLGNQCLRQIYEMLSIA